MDIILTVDASDGFNSDQWHKTKDFLKTFLKGMQHTDFKPELTEQIRFKKHYENEIESQESKPDIKYSLVQISKSPKVIVKMSDNVTLIEGLIDKLSASSENSIENVKDLLGSVGRRNGAKTIIVEVTTIPTLDHKEFLLGEDTEIFVYNILGHHTDENEEEEPETFEVEVFNEEDLLNEIENIVINCPHHGVHHSKRVRSE